MKNIRMDSRERTACFTGHRNIPEEDRALLKEKVRTALLQAWERGYRVFLCGGARGFDTLAALEVLTFRREHSDIRLFLVIPCATQAERWSNEEKGIYRSVLEQADERIILSETYYNGCMQARNRYMVDASSLCFCYLKRFEGGTWSTVRYALHCGYPVTLKNLAMAEDPAAGMKENQWNFTYIFPSVSGSAGIVHLSPGMLPKRRRKNISVRSSGKRK